MTPITPTDDLIGPIVHQLATNISQYVTGIGRMYEEVPDGAPENNSVVFPVASFKFKYDDATGKVFLSITFAIRYLIRRTKFQDNMLTAYQYMSAITRVLTAWSTQSLTDPFGNDLAMEVNPRFGGFSQTTMAGIPFVMVLLNTEVLTEFNPITS